MEELSGELSGPLLGSSKPQVHAVYLPHTGGHGCPGRVLGAAARGGSGAAGPGQPAGCAPCRGPGAPTA